MHSNVDYITVSSIHWIIGGRYFSAVILYNGDDLWGFAVTDTNCRIEISYSYNQAIRELEL